MQTWITDIDINKSASNLHWRHLNAQIYEGIHILSSLLNINDKLVTPKRSVINHPATMQWKGYEKELYHYILIHCKHLKSYGTDKYYETITYKNMKLIEGYINTSAKLKYPDWFKIHIPIHRSNLVLKNEDHYKALFGKAIYSDNARVYGGKILN